MEIQTETDGSWTVLKLIRWTADYLAGKGIITARLDGELLLAHLLEMDRTHLYMNFDQPLNGEELTRFRALVKRRGHREPLQYITGCQEFWSMPFKVSPQVLIPRPETELLVEEGIKAHGSTFSPHEASEILDIGTGSGALAAALAREIPLATVTGVDVSKAAIALARENMALNELSDRVTVEEGDLFEPVGNRRFHLILSNPPYIPKAEIAALQPEVSRFEPASALDGGSDGLDYYRRIIPAAPDHLTPSGWLLLEHGMGQSGDIIALYEKTGRFRNMESIADLAGIDRVVKGQLAD